MAEMEGQGAEDLKEKFARLGRKDPKTPGAVTSPVAAGSEGKEGKEGKSVPNEALHNFVRMASNRSADRAVSRRLAGFW